MNNMQNAPAGDPTVPPAQMGKYDEIWWAKFDLLKRIKRAGGDPNVPTTHETHGNWLAIQRTAWRNGRLAPERSVALTAIGVRLGKSAKPVKAKRPRAMAEQKRWSIRIISVQSIFAAFKRGDDVLGKGKLHKIGKWFKAQFDDMEAGLLSPEQAEALRGITIRWDVKRGWYDPNGVEPLLLDMPPPKIKPRKHAVVVPRPLAKASGGLSRQPFPRPLFGSITPEVRAWWGSFDKLEADWLANKKPLLNPDLALQDWLQKQVRAGEAGTLSNGRTKALRHIGLLA